MRTKLNLLMRSKHICSKKYGRYGPPLSENRIKVEFSEEFEKKTITDLEKLNKFWVAHYANSFTL